MQLCTKTLSAVREYIYIVREEGLGLSAGHLLCEAMGAYTCII